MNYTLILGLNLLNLHSLLKKKNQNKLSKEIQKFKRKIQGSCQSFNVVRDIQISLMLQRCFMTMDSHKNV
ncbi:unnamed protein product [Paramecium octaurelia]|uniref:Uncharacterized protein n=1 Tax=Paramecium octaurelia TaxID=43137 RepID=A0A8S1SN70_PAROT|nr:unnamed protein product [Paramecium octaurelia]